MLRATFQHLGGIGPVTEVGLWREGIRDWATLRERTRTLGVSAAGEQRILGELAASERALAERDAAWFGRRLPDREHWRMHAEFRERTAFLDIETTGLSPYAGIVTVVSVHGGGATRTFVAGDNLEELPAYLRRFPILVTFNGSRFDVPFLEACFPQFVAPPVHIDLRFVLYRLGHAGGLKRIEERLGVGDRSGVEGIHGLDAVRLWQEYRRGSAASLDRLVRYNRADTVNLEPLLEFAETELERRVFPPETAARPGELRARTAAPAGG
ncbi:MAG: ribonuclease H-like domain-containing protein [Thermoplasmata archaeon]